MDLTTALNHSLRYDAEYGQRLANHLPMLLVALHRLGASDNRLSAASATYAAKLHPMPPLQPWQAGEPWRAPLGRPSIWPRYRSLFTAWLQEEGAGETLRQVLPALMPGCGAAAFHGLIRTAYAVDAAHRAELAHALAYWGSRWLDLGVAAAEADTSANKPNGTTANPAPLLKAAAAVPGVAGSLSGHIVECMHHAAWQPGFAQAVQGLRLDEATLHRLARHAAQLYARSGNFTVLHLVTSAWAMRVLRPFVEDDLQAALSSYWRAYAAGVAGVSAQLKPRPAPAPMPWPQIVQAAVNSDDEHLVKLVHACQQEQRAYGGADDWQRAASRAVMSA